MPLRPSSRQLAAQLALLDAERRRATRRPARVPRALLLVARPPPTSRGSAASRPLLDPQPSATLPRPLRLAAGASSSARAASPCSSRRSRVGVLLVLACCCACSLSNAPRAAGRDARRWERVGREFGVPRRAAAGGRVAAAQVGAAARHLHPRAAPPAVECAAFTARPGEHALPRAAGGRVRLHVCGGAATTAPSAPAASGVLRRAPALALMRRRVGARAAADPPRASGTRQTPAPAPPDAGGRGLDGGATRGSARPPRRRRFARPRRRSVSTPPSLGAGVDGGELGLELGGEAAGGGVDLLSGGAAGGGADARADSDGLALRRRDALRHPLHLVAHLGEEGAQRRRLRRARVSAEGSCRRQPRPRSPPGGASTAARGRARRRAAGARPPRRGWSRAASYEHGVHRRSPAPAPVVEGRRQAGARAGRRCARLWATPCVRDASRDRHGLDLREVRRDVDVRRHPRRRRRRRRRGPPRAALRFLLGGAARRLDVDDALADAAGADGARRRAVGVVVEAAPPSPRAPEGARRTRSHQVGGALAARSALLHAELLLELEAAPPSDPFSSSYWRTGALLRLDLDLGLEAELREVHHRVLAGGARRQARARHFVSAFTSATALAAVALLDQPLDRRVRAATTVLWRSTSCTASRSPYTPTSYSFMRGGARR